MFEHSELLARLAHAVSRPPPGRPLAQSLAQGCQEILETDGVSLTLYNSGVDRVTLYTSDPVADRLEQLQDVLTEGPCWQSYLTNQQVRTTLDEQTPAWTEFTRTARTELGPLALFSVPMRQAGTAIGVISFYQQLPHGLIAGPQGPPVGQFLADAVAFSLTNHADVEEVLGLSWNKRARVHQATGMVVAQLHISVKDALALLRASAYAHNTTVADIAERVLNRTLDFGRKDDE